MADKGKNKKERTCETPSLLKRSFKDTELKDNEDKFYHDNSNSSSSPKKSKVYPYRDQKNESLDVDSLRNSTFEVDFASFSNSLDSETWPTPLSNIGSQDSLELSSVIQRCDNATLNSLSMSGDNAISSPFPQTVEMESLSQPKVPSLNSISMKDLLHFPSKTDSESVDMISLSSQTSVLKGEFSDTNDSFTGNTVIEIKTVSSFITTTSGSDKRTQVSEEKVIFSNEKDPTENASTLHKSTEQSHSNSNMNNPKSSRNMKTSCKRKQCAKNKEDPELITSLSNEIHSFLKEKHSACDKESGHKGFHSPKDLKVTHLPSEIQHEDSVTFFQCLSNLMVQITVSHTSNRRSKCDVYSSYIGTNKDRDGSGFITSTDENRMKIKCTRKNCLGHEGGSYCSSDVQVCKHDTSYNNMNTSNKNDHYIYGGVFVRTNRHVIFDQSEADNACVNFFFHSANCKEIIRGHVASISGVNNEQDYIVLHVMSHDKLLNDTVRMHMKNAKSSYNQMIKSTHNIQQLPDSNKLSWVAVLSFPHGAPISVSFGQLRKEEAETKRVIKYYDASTCPGSSGGLVVTPTLLHLQWPGAVHSSFCQKSKLNVSLDSRSQELDPSVINYMYKNIVNQIDYAPENDYKI